MVAWGRVLILLTAAVFGAWFFAFRPGFLGGPAGYVIVAGKSMEPALYTGDLVITRKQPEYRPGDTVAFRVEGGIVIHRIVGGRRWRHLPGKGRWLATARQPQNFAVLVGGMAGFSLLGGRTLHKRRRRKAGFDMATKRIKKAGTLGRLLGLPAAANANGARANGSHPAAVVSSAPGLAGALWGGLALGLPALLTLALGYFAYTALSGPAAKARFVERARYEQRGAFDYSVIVQPSTLSPRGVIGPGVAPE